MKEKADYQPMMRLILSKFKPPVAQNALTAVAWCARAYVILHRQGRARLGRDTEWVHDENYSVSVSIVPQFDRSREGFWPGRSGCGLRIQNSAEHGITGFINLFGIVSLGLMSAIAIVNHALGLTKDASR
jgi:hypothetical protein